MGLFSSLFGRKNKYDVIEARPYEGERPYTAKELGYGADELRPLSENYLKQILDRSQGQGLVGFDPARRSILRNEFLADLGDSEEESRRRLQAQSASQGLRGGIPLDIATRSAKDYSRARASGLADIDIADLTARREDINRATYAQPDAVNQGANIQNARANFDLGVYNATQPTYVGQTGGSNLSGLGSLIGTIAGSASGIPGLDKLGSMFGGKSGGGGNLSFLDPRIPEYYNPMSGFLGARSRRF